MRLQRALYEYFVGGIQTNISLFQRILADPDFQEARLDTGYLERLLAREHGHAGDDKSQLEQGVAAIAAGLFEGMDSAAGLKLSSGNGSAPTTQARNTSGWKQAALREALRG